MFLAQQTAAPVVEHPRSNLSLVVTDIQAIVGAITAVGATIAASIRWGTGKMARAQDRNVAAMVKSAESNATLAAGFASLTDQFKVLVVRFDRLVDALVRGGTVSAMAAGTLYAAPDPAIPTAIVVGGSGGSDGRREESQRVETPATKKPKGKVRGATGRGD